MTRYLWTLAALTFAVRLLLILFNPSPAISADLHGWLEVVKVLGAAQNPYHETTYLNWPPFWLLALTALQYLAHALSLPLTFLIKLFLALADAGVCVLLMHLLKTNHTASQTLGLAALAVTFQPLLIMVSAVQGNFDSWLLLFILAGLVALNARRWRTACFCFGVATLVKTVGIAAVPLLFFHLPREWKDRAIGSVLYLLPWLLPTGVLTILYPTDMFTKVWLYQSAVGWSGMTGLLAIVGLQEWAAFYGRLFTILYMVILVRLCYWAAKASASLSFARQLIFLGLLFLAAPLWGPAYGPQHLVWSLPLFFSTYCLGDAAWKKILILTWILVSLTCLVEYSLMPSHGILLFSWVNQSAWLTHVAVALTAPAVQTGLRLPLFVVLVVLFVMGCRRLSFRS